MAMDHGEKRASQSEDAGGEQQDAPRPQQPPEINCEWADEHQRGVEGAVKPRAVVEAYADVPFQIGKAESKHAAGKSNESRSYDDPQDPQERPRRDFRRHGRGGTARDVCWRRANDARSSHDFPATVSS